MSTVRTRSVRMARAPASSPAVAGFRPAGAALAVAAAFALQPALVQAQPSGAQVVHGKATIVGSGSNLSITTQNGAGTNHSAINWQSFSVPTGSVTHFNQPSATSTSINRVMGPDPSAIFGTLSSNGRLVLVNPAGIAVGAGAVVDTGGFTASTLRMADADALAGRLRFGGGGTAGLLQVDGRIVSRHGDVVLIAPQVQTGASAVVESNGAAVLAAGQKVDITGRGLEGIHMEVQAGDKAVNLGTLKGDAVGIFANTLKHSGLVQAQASTNEGGKVVLKAIGGDAVVDGRITAARLGGKGGSVDILGERVALLAGARVEVNGQLGGGQVRIGGDYQGNNAAVPNAQRTYVDANARIEANALASGDGGRVIVWADGDTRMHGQISARGGAASGDGGFVEVSGKQGLEFKGRVDLRAPNGVTGTLLLDPEDVVIVDGPSSNTYSPGGDPFMFQPTTGTLTLTDGDVIEQLGYSNVKITTAAPSGSGGDITLEAGASIDWSNNHSLEMRADRNILIRGSINGSSVDSSVNLVALGGDVDVASGSSVAAGTVSVTASQGITGMGDFRSRGRATADAATGGVTLIAQAGGVSFNSINSSGWNQGHHAGKVKISATGGSVSGGYIDASGGYNSTFGGNGGPVEVIATGSIQIASIDAYGGSQSIAGGKGGMVKLEANDNVVIGEINAYGGAGEGYSGVSGAGGMGGDVVIDAWNGSVTVGTIDVSGGLGNSSTASGNGGTVKISAGTDITLVGGSEGEAAIRARGGDNYSGAAGNGGSVDLKAGGSIVLAAPPPDEDFSGFALDDEDLPPYPVSISANGGSGGTAGTGGVVVVEAGGSLALGRVDATGGYADQGVGATGGQGGNVTLLFGGGISDTLVVANGGGGDYNNEGASGTGGLGGNIKLQRTGTGDMLLDSSVWLVAQGGQGGYSETAPGTGGNGGTVELLADGGRVILRSPTISAAGGEGGTNDGGSLVGATGAFGTFSAMGKSVEVESAFMLNAMWNNSSNVHIRGVSVDGPGSFRNLSDLFFYDGASMSVAVENKGRLGTFGNNMVNLVENLGTVEVAAGSRLFTPSFLSNKGKVHVDGRMDIGSLPPSDTTASATPSVSGSTFVNEAGALLSGSGTFAVDAGNGLVNNFGTINPGKVGGVGLLTLESSLAMQPGSTLAIDLLSTSSFDVLKVTGIAATGGSVDVNYLFGASFLQGDTFAVLQAGSLDSSTMPAVTKPQLTAAASGNNLLLVAQTAVLPGSAPEVQEVNNQVVQFANLFVQQSEQQRLDEARENRIGKDDIVVTDAACTPR